MLQGSLCQLWFSLTDGRLHVETTKLEGQRKCPHPISRSFPHHSSNQDSYAPGLNFFWSSQHLFSGTSRSEAKPPYRCSTNCGASLFRGPSSSLPEPLLQIPTIPLCYPSPKCGTCFLQFFLLYCPVLLQQPAPLIPFNRNSPFEIPSMIWSFLPRP